MGAPAPDRWAEIAPLLDAALDLAPEQRAAFVAERCGANFGLRREVERVLAAVERAANFLETPATADVSPLVARMAQVERRGPGDRLGAYTIERELGRGGMATVYLARDTRHDRLVALKVLDEELSFTLGADRFSRETAIAARLNHPHVLPLFDSGLIDLATGSVLFYAMPYIEGRSLRERLRGEPQLPIETAVSIGRQVAAALDHAHQHGIVHRDIKPENVLLAGEHAFVADFGIAFALDGSGGDRLTRTGLSLGTPAYMSPEQATTGRVDGRSDLYSLGCVLYEMLAGRPPFTGLNASAVLAQHATQIVPPLRALRPEMSAPLERVIMRALEKMPEARYPTGGELAAALASPPASAPAGDAGSHPTVEPRPRTRRRGALALALGVAAAVATVAVLQGRRAAAPAAEEDPLAVAIVPFTTTRAEPSPGLGESVVELLSARLDGTQVVHPVEPRAVLQAWRSLGGRDGSTEAQALQVARKVGAPRLVTGEITRDGPRVTVSSVLHDVAGHRAVMREAVEGPADSVTALLDRLAVRLLAAAAGGDQDRLQNMGQVSLPAIRAYVDGDALDRRGLSDSAAMRFQEAIRQDSSFALAGLRLMQTASWPGADSGANVVAWLHRDRLSIADRADLTVVLGPRYPAPSRVREVLAAAEHYAEVAPARPWAWQELGFQLIENGPLLGVPEALPRAVSAFRRAVAIDSTSTLGLVGLTLAASVQGDTGVARQALATFRRLQRDTLSDADFEPAWYLAATTGDTAEQWRLVRRESLAPLVTGWPGSHGFTILSFGLSQGADVRPAGPVLEHALAAAATEKQRSAVRWNQGLLDAISGHLGSKPTGLPAFPDYVQSGGPVLRVLFSDGDTAGYDRAGMALLQGIGSSRKDECCIPHFAAGEYALATNRLALAERAAVDLRTYRGAAIDADSAFATAISHAYGVVLTAQIAARRHDPAAKARLRELDSLLTDPLDGWMPAVGNLVAARLHEDRGEREAALTALRRRQWGLVCAYFVVYHREEGRLAALVGDTAGAVLAYRRYLALRGNADPPLQPRVLQVRQALAALEAGKPQ